MKIGILTFHWAVNYGAVLQTYALQRSLELLGHDVEVINYVPHSYRVSLWRYIKNPRLLKNLRKDIRQAKRDKKIDVFRQDFLHLSTTYNNANCLIESNLNYDVIISGSDQVLNPGFTCNGEGAPTSVYYLPFSEKINKIGYAISFGCIDYPEQAKQYAIKWINNFDSISVREESGLQVLSSLNYKRAGVLVPDPTVLLGSKLIDEVIAAPSFTKNRICVYMLRHPKRYNIPNAYYIDDLSHPLTVNEWISAIRFAKGVITNSYHGMIVSILNHVPFVVLLEKGKGAGMNDRFVTLLNRLGLESRICDTISEYHVILDRAIDWGSVERKITELREIGWSFLQEQLKN